MRRPSPIAWWMPGGRSAEAKRCATLTNFCVASSSSKTSLSISAVSPDGPGAAAFRARRKLVRRRSAGMSTGSGGSYWSTAGSRAWYGACGRRFGSGEFVQSAALSGRQRSCAESLAGGGQFALVYQLSGSVCLLVRPGVAGLCSYYGVGGVCIGQKC